MADYTKSAEADLIAHQAVTHPNTILSSDTDVSSDLGVTIICYHAIIEATANTNSGSFLIQVSTAKPNGTKDESWVTVVEFVTGTDTGQVDNLNGGGEPQGETTIALDDTTDHAAGDWVYIQDTTTETDSEWCLTQSVDAGTAIDIVDGLAVAKDDDDDCWLFAEVFTCYLDLTAVNRIRVIYMHEGGTGADTAIWVKMSKGTDIE